MIKTISIKNHRGEIIDLELRNPQKSGFVVKSVDGLGPVAANINSTELATADGVFYNSARVGKRNIVLTLAFMETPGVSIESIRQLSYRFFSAKKQLELTVHTDNRVLSTKGYVETNEPDIFSRSEGTRISIICPNPYFYSADSQVNTTAEFSQITPLFEFPFSNESLTTKLLVFGGVSPLPVPIIQYPGDIDAGFVITISATGFARDVIIVNRYTNEKMTIDSSQLFRLTGNEFIAGDVLTISTLTGSKYAELVRNGIRYNVTSAIAKDSQWLTLKPGKNEFEFNVVGESSNLNFSISYEVLYEGV